MAKAPSKTREVSPAGDIPDDQVFVAYAPPGANFSVKIPEGWARTEQAGATSFTDKLNTVSIMSSKSAVAPTTTSVVTYDLPTIKASETKVTGGKARVVRRRSGVAVLLTYQRDGGRNALTGKSVHEAVERYVFWRSGTSAILTLSGPVGADNVDPWKIVTDSFTWK